MTNPKIGIFAANLLRRIANTDKKEALLLAEDAYKAQQEGKEYHSSHGYVMDATGTQIVTMFVTRLNGTHAIIMPDGPFRFGDENLFIEKDQIPAALWHSVTNRECIGMMPSIFKNLIGYDLDPYVEEAGITEQEEIDIRIGGEKIFYLFTMKPKQIDFDTLLEEMRAI